MVRVERGPQKTAPVAQAASSPAAVEPALVEAEKAEEEEESRRASEDLEDPVEETITIPKKEAPVPTAGLPVAFTFDLKPGASDYASCTGVYTLAEGEGAMNGKPVYVNEEKQRFLAFSGRVWEITATGYLSELEQHHDLHGFWPGSFGGFHSGAGDNVERADQATWPSYTVTPQWAA